MSKAVYKPKVERCYGTSAHQCNGVTRPHWRVTDTSGYPTYWHTWRRAMLRATKGW